MPRALVTGAAGFLGFHLMRALARRGGFSVIGVDNFVRGENDDYLKALESRPNVTFIEADLAKEAAVAALPDDVEYVYHLAALNGTQNFYERPLDVLRCCTIPTLLLAEKFAECRSLQRFVYAGTSEAYASVVSRFEWPVPTKEDVPLGIDDVHNPRWSYAVSKMHGEVVTAQTGRAAKMPYSIIRYHNVYGPRMGDKHVIPDFYARVKAGQYVLFGHEDTRSFLYVDDAVAATVMVAEAESCEGQVVNIGSEEEMRIADLAVKMLRVRDVHHAIDLRPSPRGSVKRRAPDITKLKELTGFRQTVSLDAGLSATAAFYLDGKLVEPLVPELQASA